VADDLIGLSIGTNGSNIIAARRIPGVLDIVLDEETHNFTVYGETKEAALKAREMLEFLETEVLVPRAYVGMFAAAVFRLCCGRLVLAPCNVPLKCGKTPSFLLGHRPIFFYDQKNSSQFSQKF